MVVWETPDVPELTFRSAVPADVGSILFFWKEAAEDSHRPTDTREAVDRLIHRDADALVLVTNDGSIVGSL